MLYDKKKLIVHPQTWPSGETCYIFDKHGWGMIRVTHCPEMENSMEHCLLSDLYVIPEKRCIGLGSALIERALEYGLGDRAEMDFTLMFDDDSIPWAREWYVRNGWQHLDYRDGGERLYKVVTKNLEENH